MYFTTNEIIDEIKNHKSNEYNYLNLLCKKFEEKNTQVQFSYINFESMLRKIQIDLFNERKLDYLKKFKLNDNIICSHLFFAYLVE
jgi:hypothetical protein